MRSRKVALAFALAATAGGSACKPNLGSPASLITGTRFVAVQAAGVGPDGVTFDGPAENVPGSRVQLTALVVSPDGTLTNPAVSWAACNNPKPLAQNNVVSDQCVQNPSLPIAAQGPQIVTTLPPDGCSVYGPQTPPPVEGMPPIRARAPDITGGFYQPFRALFPDPAGGAPIISIELARIKCDLANAPPDVTKAFTDQYTLNNNPKITSMWVAADGVTLYQVAPDGSIDVGTGADALLEVRWSADSPESFPVYDPTTRTLVTHRESLRVSWFATDGAFEHDRTGRSEDETELYADNHWTAPTTPTTVHVWVVLRDSRGGVTFSSFDINVVAQ